MPKSSFFITGLLVGLVALPLAACGAGPQPIVSTPAATRESTALPSPEVLSSPTAASQTATPTSLLGVSPEELRGVRVTFWHAQVGAEAEALNQAAKAFNTANPWGISVEISQLGSANEIVERLESGLAADAQPDLVLVNAAQAMALDRTEAGVVDLTPYLQDPLFGLSSTERNDFPPALLAQTASAGRQLGLPAGGDARVLFYNQTWAKELGYSQPPGTPEEFQQQACAAAKANMGDDTTANDGMGGWIVDPDVETMQTWMAGFGGQTVTTDGRGFSFNTSQNQAALTFLKNLLDQGCAWVARNPEPYDYFSTRGALFYSGNISDIVRQTQTHQSAGSRDEWTVLPFPAEDGKAHLLVESPAFVVMTSTPPRELAAWLYLRWLETPETQARLAQAENGLPARLSARSLMADYGSQYPQWSAAANNLETAVAEPNLPDWMKVRFIFQDASDQLFYATTKPEQVGQILQMLDQTIIEVTNEQP